MPDSPASKKLMQKADSARQEELKSQLGKSKKLIVTKEYTLPCETVLPISLSYHDKELMDKVMISKIGL